MRGFNNREGTRLLIALVGMGALVAGCEAEPVKIVIKGPKDAVESTKMKPQIAPFGKKGDTYALRASAFDKKGRYMGSAKVEWKSSNTEVATVSQSGVVTILSSGKFKVSAESVGYKTSFSDTISMSAVIVDTIRIADPKPEKGKPLIMPIGEIKKFVAEVLNDRGEVIPGAKVEWNSSSWAATVTPTGEVEARAIGNTTISAEAKNGETARIDLSVEDWANKKKRRRRR